MKFNLISLIKKCVLIFITLSLIYAVPGCSKGKTKDYNVVLIVIDTLRSDHLPFYGYKKNTAPFLNTLAQKSVVFSNTFSASSWTSPGTASIFTSLYPFQHGVLMGLLAVKMANELDPNIRINKIPEKIITITEALKEAGYATFGVSDNLNIGDKQKFDQGFDKFVTYNYSTAPNVNKTVKEWQHQIQQQGKYFLYIHYMDPHAPYRSHDPEMVVTGNKKTDSINAYDSEIQYVDNYLKELFEIFDWDQNTIFIVTSDHGEGLWDHGVKGHGYTLYREEIQVPLLILLPQQKKPIRRNENISTIDIYPTVLDLINAPLPDQLEGQSLLPLIKDKKHNFDKRFVFSYLWKKIKATVEIQATIHRNLHFIKQLPTRKELYNFQTDSRETNNGILEGFKIALKMEKVFNKFFNKCKRYKKSSENIKVDKKTLEKLKSLGYVE